MSSSDGSGGRLSFRDVFSTLPQGGLPGQSGTAFAIAALDERFVGPTLRAVVKPDNPNITFIAARGATGKSVLAKRLSATSQAPLWDLAQDRGVSGDALAARLNSYLGPAGAARFPGTDGALVVVDALDEARMRVSAQSWSEFLDSVVAACGLGHRFVMLGRERIVEDVWVHFDDAGRSCAWYEISHFDQTQRTEYVDRHCGVAGKDATETVYCDARDAVLSALAGTVDSELSETFVGYAPVLDAVVALLVRDNPIKIVNTFSGEVQAQDRVDVLKRMLLRLLVREQEKVVPTAVELGLATDMAYSAGEQISWLANELMGAAPPSLDWCAVDRRGEYVEKITAFLGDHPFRSENKWASPVFSAYVASEVLGDTNVREALGDIGRRTGLLFDFALAGGVASDLDEWQFAALHESMLAAEWQDVSAEVAIAPGHRENGVEALPGQLYLAEGEETRGTDFSLVLETPGELRLHGPTAFLSVAFPSGRIVIDDTNGSTTLGPDAFFSCERMEIRGDAVEVARRAPQSGMGEAATEVSVTIEVEHGLDLPARLVGTVPAEVLELRVPADVRLGYPWVTYGQGFAPAAAAPDERARRFLNMLMTLLRRHGHQGPMAVFDKKLQGRQSIKHAELTAVLYEMQEMGVVRYDGELIYLQPAWETHWFDGKGRPGRPSLDDRLEVWLPVMQRISKLLAS